MESGLWTDQKFEWTPFQSLHCRLREHESRRRESLSKTLISSEQRLDAQVAMQSKTTEEHRHTSDRCRMRIEECLRTTPHGAERLDRENEVINEALAEEVRRGRAEEEGK